MKITVHVTKSMTAQPKKYLRIFVQREVAAVKFIFEEKDFYCF
jgi:hypothetical protein